MGLPHVDTGSLLRAEIKNETENGKIAKSYIDKGQLVPVSLVANIIKNRLAQEDCKTVTSWMVIQEVLNKLIY